MEWKSPILPVMKSTNEGWHPIYVYYGQINKGLSASAPMQMKQNYQAGSQVDQDKIIAALTETYRSKLPPPPPQMSSSSSSSSSLSSVPYFLDLAANDAVQLSNTLNLEKKGWNGLCIEPNPIYWYRLAHRKCAVAAAFVGGERDAQEVEVSLSNEEYGGIIGEGMDNTKGTNKHDKEPQGGARHNRREEKRFTISLKTLLSQFDAPFNIDYMSLDVEGAEELIMRDFPFDVYSIHFMTIERPKPALQKLLKANGYHFVMMLVFWGETLWVHESVLNKLTMADIQAVVNSVSKFTRKKPKPGNLVFDIETGAYQ